MSDQQSLHAPASPPEAATNVKRKGKMKNTKINSSNENAELKMQMTTKKCKPEM